jgi:YVTN family beta-propeller protein
MATRIRLLSLLLLAAGCHSAALPNVPLAYVSDELSDTIIVVDPAAARVVARIPVGKRPRGLVLSPEGKKLYVALSGSPIGGFGVDEKTLPPPDRKADGIAVIDVASRKVERILPAGPNPESVAISRDGMTLYVSNQDAATLAIYDLDKNVLRARVHIGAEPSGIAVRNDGAYVFVAAQAASSVYVIDAVTLKVVATVPTSARPRAIVVADEIGGAFIADEAGHDLTMFDTTSYAPRGPLALHLDSPMPSGPRPVAGVLSPDGKQLYVVTGRGGSVAIIDVMTKKQTRSIDGVGDRPSGIAISADGTRLYTANGTSHDVSIVNIASGNVDKRIVVGGLPWGVVLSR